MLQKVEDDILAVKQTLGDVPLKVILECYYLTNDEICRASEIAVRRRSELGENRKPVGAPTGATFENVALIRKTVGNSAKVKAAGGIRDLATLQKMVELGVERFWHRQSNRDRHPQGLRRASGNGIENLSSCIDMPP